MPLDPQARAFLDQLVALGGPPLETMTPVAARQLSADRAKLSGPGEPVALVEDRIIPGPAGEIPTRIYRPTQQQPQPVLVYFDGGGWVGGGICRLLSRAVGPATASRAGKSAL